MWLQFHEKLNRKVQVHTILGDMTLMFYRNIIVYLRHTCVACIESYPGGDGTLQYVSNMSSSASSSSSSPAATDPEDVERRQWRIGPAITAGVATSVIASEAAVATSVRSGSDLWQAADGPQQHG